MEGVKEFDAAATVDYVNNVVAASIEAVPSTIELAIKAGSLSADFNEKYNKKSLIELPKFIVSGAVASLDNLKSDSFGIDEVKQSLTKIMETGTSTVKALSARLNMDQELIKETMANLAVASRFEFRGLDFDGMEDLNLDELLTSLTNGLNLGIEVEVPEIDIETPTIDPTVDFDSDLSGVDTSFNLLAETETFDGIDFSSMYPDTSSANTGSDQAPESDTHSYGALKTSFGFDTADPVQRKDGENSAISQKPSLSFDESKCSSACKVAYGASFGSIGDTDRGEACICHQTTKPLSPGTCRTFCTQYHGNALIDSRIENGKCVCQI